MHVVMKFLLSSDSCLFVDFAEIASYERRITDHHTGLYSEEKIPQLDLRHTISKDHFLAYNTAMLQSRIMI
jgi:hypothetical protein